MKNVNIISTYDQGNFTSSTKTNVILHKQQYRKIKKMLGKSDPAWVRYTDVFFNDEKTAVAEFHSMSRPGLYVFGYYYPAFHKSEKNSRILYLLEADLKKENHKQGKIPKSRKGRLVLKWRDVMSENIREINYAEYKGGRYDQYNRHSAEDKETSVERSKELNISRNMSGHLRVVSTGPYLSYPEVLGYKNICVSIRTAGKSKELSTVFMGPITNPSLLSLDILWKICQVREDDVDQSGNSMKSFQLKASLGKNYPYTSEIDLSDNGKKTLFYLWYDRKLNEVEARKEIFCPFYIDFARKTESFRNIKNLIKDGYNVQLITYDATPYSTEYDPDGQILKDIFNDPSKPFTNAHVLAGMLTKNHVWE